LERSEVSQEQPVQRRVISAARPDEQLQSGFRIAGTGGQPIVELRGEKTIVGQAGSSPEIDADSIKPVHAADIAFCPDRRGATFRK
jgi:hypothetical protein